MKTSENSDLRATINSLNLGILIVDNDLNIEMVNDTFHDLWATSEDDFEIGDSICRLIEANRTKGIYDIKDEEWDDYLENRLKEIRKGNVKPREFTRADGKCMVYSVTNLSDDRRLISYFDVTSQKKNEVALEKARSEYSSTRNRLTTAIEALDDGFVLFDEDDRLVICNQSFLDQFGEAAKFMQPGRSSLEMMTDFAYSGIIPGIEGKEEEFVSDLLEQRRSKLGLEKVFQTHDGRWIKQRDKKTSSGEIVGLRTDVTELKKREQEAEEARLLLESTASQMPQAMLVFHQEKVEYFNQRLLEIFNLTEDQVYIDQSIEELLDNILNNSYKYAPETMREAILNKVRNQEKNQTETLTDAGISMRVEGTPLGENRYLYTYTDTTDIRKRELELEEQRKESEATFRLLESMTSDMPQAILVYRDEKIEYFNRRMQEIFSLSDENIYIGQSIENFLDIHTRVSLRQGGEEVRERILKNVQTGVSYTRETETISGATLHIEGTALADGRYLYTYTDISEMKQRELEIEEQRRKAEAAERAKSEFLANMSHEIRTPMNGVMGMAELLAATELDTKQKTFTDVIVKSGASLLTIINDILDFSKIDAGQMELNPAAFNLAEAIEDVATLVSAKVVEKDLELIVRVDPELPKSVVGDVGRLRQVVTNLMGNAVKFTEKGHVYVNVDGSVNDQGNVALRFEVQDTGIGIPKDQCDQVFKMFSQVDTSATRKHEGTGLGLSIASSLIRLMGGEIKVESEVGQGSTFWFEIEMPVAEMEKKFVKAVPGDYTGSRVLIIDDNGVNRSILTEQMTAWEFDSAAASSGGEGLRMVDAIQNAGLELDLIILDYQMPVMSGAEVLSNLRSRAETRNIPVIMLTSVDSSQATRQLNELGVEANLTKPTRSSVLLETILQVIATSRAESAATIMQQPPAVQADASPATEAPVAQAPETPEAAEQTPLVLNATGNEDTPLAGSEKSLDVMIAEDNEVNQIVFTQILDETGLNYKIVENGRLAYSTYKLRRPSMILMDVSMPEMNGKEATAEIRKFERENNLQPTPIVGVTAHALKGDMEACLDAGMDDYLSKPVSPNKLVRKIEQWLKRDLSHANVG